DTINRINIVDINTNTVLDPINIGDANSWIALANVTYPTDGDAPVIYSITPTAPHSPAQTGDEITVTFTASEPLNSLTVKMDPDKPFTCTNSGLNYTCTRTLDGTEIGGTNQIAITATDGSGNTTTEYSSIEVAGLATPTPTPTATPTS